MSRHRPYHEFWEKTANSGDAKWAHWIAGPGSREKPSISISGFACDEGVRRNNGFPGASYGPEAIRQQLAHQTLAFRPHLALKDAGDISCQDENLEEAQNALGKQTAAVLARGNRSLVFGGGHETSWGHFQGISATLMKKSCHLAIINFDAHFDLKPVSPEGKGHSGSPFSQILGWAREHGCQVSYHCLGIQDSYNSHELFRTARSTGTRFLSAEDMHVLGRDKTAHFIRKASEPADLIYLSLCLDAFSSSVAPGVSSVQPLGLHPWQVIPFANELARSGKLIAADIVELCPPRDINSMTARLAACLASSLLKNWTAGV